MRRVRLSKPDVDPVLDRTERSLIERSLAWLRSTRPHDSAVLWNHVKRVAFLGELHEQTPSLLMPTILGAVQRSTGALVKELVRLDPMGGGLMLPEKAHVARAFLLSKIGLLQEFEMALSPGADGAEPQLCAEVHTELAQSIYTLIATEILVGLLGDQGVHERSKNRAARQLLLIWERAAQVEIDDFCPLLEAVWIARSRVRVRFGALLGAGEYMRLAACDCPPEFLDFFCRDDVAEDEMQSFEEFLFNLPYEDLVRLRAISKEDGGHVVTLEEAARVLGRPLDEAASIDDPRALYRSYTRRRTAAEFRLFTGAPGPQRPAEAYMMLRVLDDTTATSTGEFAAARPPPPKDSH